jgi:glycosyltransferase involved in cell wall biosynthesis
MRLVVASVTKQHAYPIAAAANEDGALEQFITSLYYKPHKLNYRLLERAIRATGNKADLARIQARREDGLEDQRVTSVFWPEFTELVWRRSRLLARVVHPDSVTYLKNEVFDWTVARHLPECDIFHGFEQCALFSLRRAKKMGAVTVLDQPVIHRRLWDRLEAEERRCVGLPIPKRPFWYRQHIERKYEELKLADYLFVGLEYVRQSFIGEGFPAERIFLIPYGADLHTSFRPVERPVRRTFNILFLGQISWYKGLHYLLDAFEKFQAKDVSLTIIGMVHPEWLPYFRKRFPQFSGVRYLGTVAHDELPRHYAEADVFVFPSLGGGIGLSVYEAMATGLPVITSDGDVVIRDGVDGLVVPARDTQGWIHALTTLRDNLELRRTLGQSAVERVQEFGWETYRAKVMEAYRVIAQRERMGWKTTELK